MKSEGVLPRLGKDTSVRYFLIRLAWSLLLGTLAPHLGEALIAVYRASTPGLEGNFALGTTGGAGYFGLLAWPFGSSVASLSPS